MFTKLCNSHHRLIPEHFYYPKKTPAPRSSPSPDPSPSRPISLLSACLGWASLDISPEQNHRVGVKAALPVCLPSVSHSPPFFWFSFRSFCHSLNKRPNHLLS